MNFARSDISTRSFDFEVELNNGTVHVFNSMEKFVFCDFSNLTIIILFVQF